MNAKPGVGIVIPCYQQARFLRGAIESALAQSIPPTEIIVVDDGSTDDPEQVVRDFPQVQFVRQPNRGLAGARNAGLRRATSEKIIFLDSDDRLVPDAIAAGLGAFGKHPDAAFVYGGYREVRLLREKDRFRPAETRCDLIRINAIGMIAAVMFDRAKLIEVGGFDETLRMCEDWDVYLRLSRKYPFAFHRDIVARYVRHRGNMSNDTNALRRWIAVVRDHERARGLAAHEEAAWQEGVAVLAAAYPKPLQRATRFVRKLLGGA